MFYKVKGNKNFKKLINSQEVIDNKQEINYNEYKLIIISDEEFERDCNINATPKGQMCIRDRCKYGFRNGLYRK